MDTLTADLAGLASRFHLQDVYVFGSRAGEIAARVRGEAAEGPSDPASDVDIAVQPRRDAALDVHRRVELALALEDLLGVGRVDLVVLSEARPFLAVDVLRGELLYTSDPLAQAEHELYLLRRAADLAEFQRARVDSVLRRGGR